VQVREQNLAWPEQEALARLRLLHFHDHFRGREHLRGCAHHLCAAGFVLRIADADARASARLDDDLVPGSRQLAHTRWHKSDAVLVHLDLTWNADTHAA
jgi:hypothetical protein